MKYILIVLLLLSVNLSADSTGWISDGFDAEQKGEYKKAMRLYEKACNAGEMLGCNNVGVLFKMGKGVSQSYEMANKFFAQACKKGNGLSCNEIGLSLLFGNGTTKNIKESNEFFNVACVGLAADGCYNLAVHIHLSEELKRILIKQMNCIQKLVREICYGATVAQPVII